MARLGFFRFQGGSSCLFSLASFSWRNLLAPDQVRRRRLPVSTLIAWSFVPRALSDVSMCSLVVQLVRCRKKISNEDDA